MSGKAKSESLAQQYWNANKGTIVAVAPVLAIAGALGAVASAAKSVCPLSKAEKGK